MKKGLIVFLLFSLSVFNLRSQDLNVQDYGYQQWRLDYERARSDFMIGEIICGVGSVALLAGGFLMVADPKEVVTDVGWLYVKTEKRVKPGYVVMGVAGFVTLGVGGVLTSYAKQRVEFLQGFGVERGYLSVEVKPEVRGASISVRFSF